MSQKKYSLLYPDTNAQYRTLSDVTMHDLGMDQICKKLSAKEREQNYIQNVMAHMYADPAVTQYRCDIFEDVLQQKKMRDDLMEILERISFHRELVELLLLLGFIIYVFHNSFNLYAWQALSPQ